MLWDMWEDECLYLWPRRADMFDCAFMMGDLDMLVGAKLKGPLGWCGVSEESPGVKYAVDGVGTGGLSDVDIMVERWT